MNMSQTLGDNTIGEVAGRFNVLETNSSLIQGGHSHTPMRWAIIREPSVSGSTSNRNGPEWTEMSRNGPKWSFSSKCFRI